MQKKKDPIRRNHAARRSVLDWISRQVKASMACRQKKITRFFLGEIVPKTTGHGMLCDLSRGDTAAGGGWDGREMKIRRLT